LTATEKPVDASTPPALKKDWRFYAGVTAMVLAVVMPLCVLAVPMLGLSTTQSALLAGVLLAGGPEMLCILAVALLGKDTFCYFTHRS
jgi:sterol desaturase/sphingolipid hydroxylase (fatty acid hydroxylase superfamily)